MQEMKAVSDAFEIKTCESEANGTFTIGLGFDINERTGSRATMRRLVGTVP